MPSESELLAEIDKLKDDLANAKEEVTIRDKALDEMDQELEEMKGKLMDREKEAQKLQVQLDKYTEHGDGNEDWKDEEIRDLKIQLAVSEDKLRRSKSDQGDSGSADLEEKLKVMEEEKKVLEEQVNKLLELAEKNTSGSGEFDESAMEVEILTKEIMDLRDDLESSSFRYTEHLEEKMALIDKLEYELRQYKGKAEDLQAESKKLQSVSQASYDDYLALKDQMQIIESQNQLMSSQLDSQKSEIEQRTDLAKAKDRGRRQSRKGTAGRYMSSEEIEKFKEKETALQAHNSLLSAEIKRWEAETQVRNETIKRLQSELREVRSESILKSEVENGKDIDELNRQLENLRSRYFVSTAVGVKVQGAQFGWYANVDCHLLYDRALNAKIPLEDWPEWITEEIKKASKPLE